MILQELKNIKSTRSELKKFGYTMTVVLLIISLIIYLYSNSIYIYFASSAGILLLLTLIAPKLLLPFQKVWMGLAVILNFIMTRIILSLLYYLILTPLGLILKLTGKDFMERTLSKNKSSYWNIREDNKYLPEHTERQF